MIERLSARTLGDLRRLQELEVLCGRQQTMILRLTERIAALEERLGKNSRNSSLPSSMDGPAATTRREAAQLMKTDERMWTFLDVEGMPPTNNLAEGCLRWAVIWRKKFLGTDAEAGSRFVERILSTVLSLRMQERDVFEFLVQAREAAVHGTTPPSLCPTT